MLFVLFSILLYFNFHFCSVRLDFLFFPSNTPSFYCIVFVVFILFHYFLFYYVFSTVFHNISHNSILLYSILLLFSCNYIYSYFNLFYSILLYNVYFLLFHIILHSILLLPVYYSILSYIIKHYFPFSILFHFPHTYTILFYFILVRALRAQNWWCHRQHSLPAYPQPWTCLTNTYFPCVSPLYEWRFSLWGGGWMNGEGSRE